MQKVKAFLMKVGKYAVFVIVGIIGGVIVTLLRQRRNKPGANLLHNRGAANGTADPHKELGKQLDDIEGNLGRQAEIIGRERSLIEREREIIRDSRDDAQAIRDIISAVTTQKPTT